MDKKKFKNDEELIAFLEREEEAGMFKTNQWTSMWQESLRYFFSDQLHYKKKHKDWQWVTLNYIWPSAIQEVSKLSKNPPKIYARPWEDTDADAAEAWQSHMQWQWEKGVNGDGMRLEQIAAIFEGKIFGYRVSKMFWEKNRKWDDQKKQWVGDVKYKLWHPAEFWASDEEKIEDGNCGSVRCVTLDYAISQWPELEKELREKAKKLKDSDYVVGGINHIRGQLGTAGTYPGTGIGDVDKGTDVGYPNRLLDRILKADRMNQSQDVNQDDTEFVKLSETYFYDGSTRHVVNKEPIPAQILIESGAIINDGVQFINSLTNKPMAPEEWPEKIISEYDEPLFPDGRYVVRVDDLILNPGEENQRWLYSRWPFIVSPHYLLPHMWQGMDGVQMYKDTQDMINVTVSHLANNMKLYGDPRIAVEKGVIDVPPGRMKKHYKIGSGAGSIIRLVRGGLKRFKILDPPAPSAAALQLYGLFSQEFRNLIGIQKISQGEALSKEMSASESQILAISANDRIALQSAYEDVWIKKVITLLAEICQRNYEPERWIRIVGPDAMDGVTQITQGLKTIKFDIDIIPGATLPYDDEKRKASVLKAYEVMSSPNPNPMLPEVLRELEVPNWKEKLQQHKGWQRFTEFMQLYEAIASGEMEPEVAVRILLQRIMEEFAKTPKAQEDAEIKQKEGSKNA